jgi:hypothetical protein
MGTTTVFDAHLAYSADSKNKNYAAPVLSIIGRYLIESWGGQAHKTSRASRHEQSAIEDLLKKLPISLLINSQNVLEEAFVAKNVNAERRKAYKSTYKSFLTWIESNNYYPLNTEEINIDTPEAQADTRRKRPQGSGTNRKANYHNTKQKKPYALMSKHSNYRAELVGQLIYPDDYINKKLAQEINDFQKFREEHHGCSENTIEKDVAVICRILGWLHRNKGLSLEELSLTSIINFTPLNLSISEAIDLEGKLDYNQYFFKKSMSQQKALDLANENRRLIQEYIDFIGGHPNTKVINVNTCIAIAKFIFRNELGSEDYVDDIDLPIIRRLNQLSINLSKKAKSSPPSIPYANKSIPWEDVITLLQICKKEADTITTCSGRMKQKNVAANDLQDFLSLAFMTLIPVDRARTYYELEVDKTFVYGIYKDDRFTPADRIKDNSQATWYIHLMPGDYKTGKIYGEYWGEMPDVEFSDDTKLYQYIDKWLNSQRNCNKKCNHNKFFRQKVTYQKMNKCDWTKCIKNIFVDMAKIPVTPKELRKMYVTYLNNQGATNAELKGAAHAMHHSPQMQEKIYNSQRILEKIAPIYKFNERMHELAFTKPKNSDSKTIKADK